MVKQKQVTLYIPETSLLILDLMKKEGYAVSRSGALTHVIKRYLIYMRRKENLDKKYVNEVFEYAERIKISECKLTKGDSQEN